MRSEPLFQGLSPKDAVQLQKRLAQRVRLQPLPRPRDGLLIGAADSSYERKATHGYAAIGVFRWPHLEVVEMGRAVDEIRFPYIPGLLSFRELPLLQQAWESLSQKPDLIVIDGQGLAHPRRFGLACHAGVVWDCPTIGCAKSLLVGKHRTVGTGRGCRAVLKDGLDTVGAAVRTREGVKPMFVSPGHLSDIESSIRWVLRLSDKYRLPEPIRMVHDEVNRLRRGMT